eukprot:CAMPEP_0168231894 /NCGR_PEP_ID=MMETSP0140_2-20121125/16841_1 /TAXON_ID=44445 /ORGANISM="Pseudo-nitzschia australis, Strain 10249 10 AB" /LENGTH=159 /DNA_ID=CAMNT_0008164381 /DNA_START=1047 /DNA_END=1523 /DNA_ORIENTATION=+
MRRTPSNGGVPAMVAQRCNAVPASDLRERSARNTKNGTVQRTRQTTASKPSNHQAKKNRTMRRMDAMRHDTTRHDTTRHDKTNNNYTARPSVSKNTHTTQQASKQQHDGSPNWRSETEQDACAYILCTDTAVVAMVAATGLHCIAFYWIPSHRITSHHI